MGQLKISGDISGGPASVSDGSFPSMRIDGRLALGVGASPKAYTACTGILEQAISSPSSYFELGGMGGKPVTRGDTLYLRTNAGMLMRLTTDDGAGGDVLAVVPIAGLTLLEFQAGLYLKKVELQGSGSIEYLISGS